MGLLASIQNRLSVIHVFLKFFLFFIAKLQDECIGCDNFGEIFMVFGGRAKELELWVIFLSFTKCYEKILTIYRHVLGSVLDHRHLGPAQLLRHLRTILVRLRFLYLFKNFLQKLRLLLIPLLLLNFLLNLCNLLLNFSLSVWLHFLSACHHLLTVFGNHVVIECSVRVIFSQECELGFILFHLDEGFFELGTVLCYVEGCFVDGLFYGAWGDDYTVHLLYTLVDLPNILLYIYSITVKPPSMHPVVTQQQITNSFKAALQDLPQFFLTKHSESLQAYQTHILPFQLSRIQQNKNLNSKNTSLQRHKQDLQYKIVYMREKNHRQQMRMEKQAQKILDLERTVAELERANGENLSVIEVLRIQMKELEVELNDNIQTVKKVEHEKKEILKDYEQKKNQYNALLENFMRDKNIIAEKLNFMNDLEQNLINKEKQMKEQELYLKKQWQQFQDEKKQQKQKPKIFKKPLDQIPVANTQKKQQQKPQKPGIIDQILRTPAKKIIKHHNSQIHDACIWQKQNKLFTCGADRTIKIYDLLTYTTINTIINVSQQQASFLCLAVGGDEGRRLLTGSSDKSVQVYEVEGGKELHKFVEHGMKVNCVGWLGGSDTVVSGSEDKSIRVWSLEKLESVGSISCGKAVRCLVTKPSDQLIYSGHSDGSVRVYSPTQATPVSQIKGLIDRPIISIHPLTNPSHLLVSSQQGSPLHLLDLKMNKSLLKYQGKDYCNTSGHVLVSPGQKYVVAGNCDGHLYYWGKEKANFQRKVSGHDYGIGVVRYAGDGKLVSCDCQGNVIVWCNQ